MENSSVIASMFKNAVGWEPHGQWEDWWVEVKTGVHNARDLRSALVTMAYGLQIAPDSRMLCILVNSRITTARLERELELFRTLANPFVTQSVRVATYTQITGYINCPEEIPVQMLEKIVQSHMGLVGQSAKGATQYTIMSLLILDWLNHAGPQTTNALCQASGASYPTVAAALKQLEAEDAITKEADRRVSLRKFPVEQWRRWIGISSQHRRSVYFVDRSGQPRSPMDLTRRLRDKVQREDIAVSGVMGAKFHYPLLDLSGDLRLDLTLHGSPNMSLDFVRALDPALERTDDPREKPSMVIHFLTRPHAHFVTGDTGILWADPIECLTDLYEARLDYQADDMLRALIENRK